MAEIRATDIGIEYDPERANPLVMIRDEKGTLHPVTKKERVRHLFTSGHTNRWEDVIVLEPDRHEQLDIQQQLDDQRHALKRISDWATEAYPPESFPDQDLERANEVLAAAGISISAMHGQWARHLIGGIGRIAKDVIRACEPEGR